MRFGFHISIAGGFSKVVGRASRCQCQTIQIFSRNPRGWASTPLGGGDVAAFREGVREAGIHPVFVHLPYLVNLATKRSTAYGRSLRVLSEDLCRAEALSASYLIMHMGSHRGSGSRRAVRTLADSINRVFREVENPVSLLLENTSGQGTQIGWCFDEIGAVIERIENKDRIGVCLDTAHAFGAGYDVSNSAGLEATLAEFDRFVGLDRLVLLHLNDTKVPLGSGRDRHWHIGKGLIGIEGFRNIVNHPRLARLPGIMETPRKEDRHDLENMRVIQSLVDPPRRSSRT
jgi:deoxyribonuclease-4